MAEPMRLTAEGCVKGIIGGRFGESNHCIVAGICGWKTVFPINISGSIRLRDLGKPAPFVAPARERLVDLLDEADARDVAAEGDTVRFKIGLFDGPGRYHPLAPFDAGTFCIEAEDTALRVRYRLSTVRLLLIVSAFAATIFAISEPGNFKHGDPWRPAEIASLGWLWLFGMNYLTAMIRVPLWLKCGLKDVVKRNQN